MIINYYSEVNKPYYTMSAKQQFCLRQIIQEYYEFNIVYFRCLLSYLLLFQDYNENILIPTFVHNTFIIFFLVAN